MLKKHLRERDNDASAAYNKTKYAMRYVVGAAMLLDQVAADTSSCNSQIVEWGFWK